MRLIDHCLAWLTVLVGVKLGFTPEIEGCYAVLVPLHSNITPFPVLYPFVPPSNLLRPTPFYIICGTIQLSLYRPTSVVTWEWLSLRLRPLLHDPRRLVLWWCGRRGNGELGFKCCEYQPQIEQLSIDINRDKRMPQIRSIRISNRIWPVNEEESFWNAKMLWWALSVDWMRLLLSNTVMYHTWHTWVDWHRTYSSFFLE